MTDWLQDPTLILFARLTLGGVLLVSAVTKARDPAGTREALARRKWLPPALVALGVWGLPLVEGLLGVALVLGLALGWTAAAAAALLAAFTLGVLADLAGGQTASCACFGRLSREPAGAGTVARNVVLLTLAGLVAWHPVPYLALDRLWGAGADRALPSALEAVPVVFLAAVTVILVVIGGILINMVRSLLQAF